MTTINPSRRGCIRKFVPSSDLPPLPDNFCWTIENPAILGPVMNQGATCMCWACTSANVVAASHNIKYDSTIELSAQELVDRAKTGRQIQRLKAKEKIDELGTYTAPIELGLNFIINKGVSLEADYPFVGKREDPPPRKRRRADQDIRRIPYYRYIDASSDEAMRHAIWMRPIAAVIQITDEFMYLAPGQIYKPTLLPDREAKDAEFHAIIIIGWGYDEEEQTYYWRLKNSWGLEWADGGYGRIARTLSMPGGFELLMNCIITDPPE